METITQVTRSIYGMLEQIAQREIEKDPLGFIRDEAFQKEGGANVLPQSDPKSNDSLLEEVKENMIVEDDEDDLYFDAERGKSQKSLYNQGLIEELEEVFHDAHDNFVHSFVSNPGNANRRNTKMFKEEEKMFQLVLTEDSLQKPDPP